MKNKLKPCPYCQNELTIKRIDGLYFNHFKIECKTPRCVSFVIGGGTIDEQIEIWNRIIERKADRENER